MLLNYQIGCKFSPATTGIFRLVTNPRRTSVIQVAIIYSTRKLKKSLLDANLAYVTTFYKDCRKLRSFIVWKGQSIKYDKKDISCDIIDKHFKGIFKSTELKKTPKISEIKSNLDSYRVHGPRPISLCMN